MGIEAVVVFSGGQDSTIALYQAIRDHGAEQVAAITFDYGQRHRGEVNAAMDITDLTRIFEHRVVVLDALSDLATSALTRDDLPLEIEGGLGGLPSAFTPSRNLVFLALASSYAISSGAHKLYTGQGCDSVYPDCRRPFVNLVEQAIAAGNGLEKFEIATPLMFLTKAETVKLAVELDCMEALALSITCYRGSRCGDCPACKLRAKGFEEAGVPDPAL
jgi:7-cyano-7-deazaguanine synthase